MSQEIINLLESENNEDVILGVIMAANTGEWDRMKKTSRGFYDRELDTNTHFYRAFYIVYDSRMYMVVGSKINRLKRSEIGTRILSNRIKYTDGTIKAKRINE